MDLFQQPGGGGSNGIIYGFDDLVSGESRIFLYDRLNRLRSVGGMPWGIDYAYDRFGNRLSVVGSASTPNFQDSAPAIDPTTNRILSAGWEYDSAGNVVEDGGAHHLRWDSAGRLIEMGPPQPSGSGPPEDDGRCTGPGCPPPPPPPPDPDPPLDDGRSSGGLKAQSAGTVAYEYDYQDRRVVKDEGTTGRIYFWDEVIGEVVWEFPLENPTSQDLLRLFLNGRLVAENDARPGGGFHYFHRDHLGTSKLMTDFFSPTVVCDEVYHPFGQVQSEQPSGCNGHVRKFTGKERDAESGLDYFRARYCDSISGRFVSPDPLLRSARLAEPKSWNRYAYVFNNPLRFIDPTGLIVEVLDDKALEALRLTVPEELRKAIVVKEGVLSVESLSAIRTDNKNFLALLDLAKSSSVIQVRTAASIAFAGVTHEFFFESAEDVIRKVGEFLGMEEAKKLGLPPNLFLGFFETPEETGGKARVTISDRTGSAIGTPDSEIGITAAHELLGHGLLFLKGKPFEHDDSGPVDKTILGIEKRTRKIFDKK